MTRIKTVAPVLLLVLLAAGPLTHAEIIEETGTLRGFFLGECPGCAYDNLLAHNVEGLADPGYNTYNPLDPQTTGFGNYLPVPDGASGDTLLARFKAVFRLLSRGEFEEAEQLRESTLSFYPFEIASLNDTLLGKTFYMMREQLDSGFVDTNNPGIDEDDEIGSFNRGWGLYVYSPEATYPWINIGIVHPNDDYIAPYVAYDMFATVDAGHLFFSTVGREVLWTQQGDYTNAKSLSDPSRNARHVFQMAHEAFVDVYLDERRHKPFMMQIHSYDTRNRNFSSAIVSAGRYDAVFNLPLFDWSGVVGGMVDRTPWEVHPAGVIGNPAPIPLTSFYGSSSAPPLEVLDTAGVVRYIPNPYDLYGHPENNQINYRLSSSDQCSDFEWAFHVECDELPNSIEDSTEAEFYGEPGFPLTWRNFESIVSYYHPMCENMRAAIDAAEAYVPSDPPTQPTDLRVVTVHDNRADLQWERSQDPHFESYRIYYDREPTVGPGSAYVDRRNIADICAQTTQEATLVANLLYSEEYFIRIAGVNQEGRESRPSEMTNFTTENTDPNWIWVTNPDGGEFWLIDSVVTVTWNSGTVGGNVMIELSRNGMEGPWETIAESTDNDGNHSLTIGAPPSNHCRIAVKSLETPAQDDTSDADFSILYGQPVISADFETTSLVWSHNAPSNWSDNWHRSSERSHSGNYSYKCGHTGTGQYSNYCDSRLTRAAITDLPPDSWLEFYYQIDAEVAQGAWAYDGAILEVSANNGAWTQLTPVDDYPRRIVTNSTGPIAGRYCWSGTLNSWTPIRFDLGNYAGDNLQIRWRFGTDNSVTREGWYIDDVLVYSTTSAILVPEAVTIQWTSDSLMIRWNEDSSPHYMIYSSSDADQPYQYYEGITDRNQFSVPTSTLVDRRFYVVVGTWDREAPPVE